MSKTKKWNEILRYERESRGWSQKELARSLDTDEKRISEWERGNTKPRPYYRAKLCERFGKNAAELGFIEKQNEVDTFTNEAQQSSRLTDKNTVSFWIDTSYIVGREEVLHQQLAYLDTPMGKPRVKLSILCGITGAGKTSCLKLLRKHLAIQDLHEVYSYVFDIQARDKTPIEHLDIFLAELLNWLGVPQPGLPKLPPLHERIARFMKEIAKKKTPLILVLDDFQVALEPDGNLATGWQQLLKDLIEADHSTTLYIASRETIWQQRERVFVAETEIDPLSEEAGVQMWHNLGFEEDETVLRQATGKCGGNPGMIEIVAQHVQRPVMSLDWSEAPLENGVQEQQGLARFVHNPHYLSHNLAIDAYPLIEQIISTQISLEARELLNTLAIAPVPLAPALLRNLSQTPGLVYKDLRRTALLARDNQRLSPATRRRIRAPTTHR